MGRGSVLNREVAVTLTDFFVLYSYLLEEAPRERKRERD